MIVKHLMRASTISAVFMVLKRSRSGTRWAEYFDCGNAADAAVAMAFSLAVGYNAEVSLGLWPLPCP